MKQKPVQCMVLCLACALPCVVFAFQGEIKVGVKIKGECGYATESTQHAHFGEQFTGKPHGVLDEDGEVAFSCPSGTTYTVNVSHEAGATHQMTLVGGTDTVDYLLVDYTPKDGTASSGVSIPVRLSFRVPANALQNAAPGDYEDQVTVTVSF
jgi:spore coat protein U-like protein